MIQNVDVAGIIQSRFIESIRANPRYSLRAFAAKLRISPGGLSQILSRKKRLSINRAHAIADALTLDANDRAAFLIQVQIESAKSPALKAELYERLRIVRGDQAGIDLSLENFQLVSNWYNFAILEIIGSIGRSWSAREIAHYLGLSSFEVEAALDRLVRLELIKKNPSGRFIRIPDRVNVSSTLPSEAIRNYYQGVLERAQKSISEQTPQEKVIGTEVFAFDPEKIEEARVATDEYLGHLVRIAKSSKNPTEIYQVFVNVFRLGESNLKKTPLKGKKK